MARIVLDASFLIDHLRGEPAAVERLRVMLESADDPIVTDVASAEVWSGWRAADDAKIESFLRYFEFVQPGPETSRLAGIWRAEARAAGSTLGVMDALIAASAFHLGASVLTRNVRDFALTSVRVETY
jgi:predicted nucleic acid-binding protein